ncbi:MAG: FHA domain-containing protein [Archangium sp.]|nr:FHA domain-containing protein [Archangium sp.]
MARGLNRTQPAGSRNPFTPSVRRFRLVVLEGPDTGTAWESTDEHCSIGQERGNELVLTDTTVSRFHCVLDATDHGVERAAASDDTVLFEGEAGTGKSQAARAIPSLFAGRRIARVGPDVHLSLRARARRRPLL